MVLFKGFERDVAGMRVENERRPLLAGKQLRAVRTTGCDPTTMTAEDEHPGVAWIVQRAQHPPVVKGHPGELPFVGAAADPSGEEQVLVGEGLDDGTGRAGAGKGREQVAHRLHDAGVGIEHDTVGRVIDETDRERHLELTAPRLGQDAAAQAGADVVELCL